MATGEPTSFWGKLRTDAGGRALEWHPLEHHCADVAATAEALLRGTLLGRRLARLGGQSELTLGQVARLGVLAALHDFGKFSIGFQNKGLPHPRPEPVCGHLCEAMALLEGASSVERFRRALAIPEIATWGDDMMGLLKATVSHHGRPVAAKSLPAAWEPARGLDPFEGMERLTESTRRWFPDAWTRDTPPLPSAPAFQHAWCGLVNLADWIGSDADRFFPFSSTVDGDRMPEARAAAARALDALGLETSASRTAIDSGQHLRLLGGAAPRPAQQAIREVEVPGDGSIAILEAETGSGKTEAALLHYLALFQEGAVDGLYFALPLRSAAVQIHGRVVAAVAEVFPQPLRPPVVLAVPGYRRVDEDEGVALPGFRTYWPEDDDLRKSYRGWAAENPKRFLAGAVVVGTVDQVLLSSLTVRHSHLRASALLRHLLVVDEVHASDAYMTRVLESVLENHVAAGGHALLMSATLGSSARVRLARKAGSPIATQSVDEAVATPYPLITVAAPGHVGTLPCDRSVARRTVTLDLRPIIDDVDAVAAILVDAAARGGRVLAIRNTVRGCVDLHEAVERIAIALGREDALFRCSEISAPHHSRFAPADRRALDEAMEQEFGKRRSGQGGRIAVATQTVEQSLDLDADLLVTDLCPMDVFLQRLGRLQRHERTRPEGFELPRAVILVPSEGDLATFIGAQGEGRGRHGLGRVYEDLRVLQATWDLARSLGTLEIPADNRRLVEETTHPEALAALVERMPDPQRWREHARRIAGGEIAKRGVARLNLVRRDCSFAELQPFPDDRRVATRLGEADRRASFPRPVIGPFGLEVTELVIRHYLVGRGTPDDLAIATDVEERHGEVRFTFGTRRFLYDRRGLGQEEAERTEDEADE